MSKLFFSGILFLITFACIAQPPAVPKGPAFDAIVKAYMQSDVKAVETAYPAFEKQYPGNAYTKFFHAYISDQTGKDIEGALREYSEVIRMSPDLSDPYAYRAVIFSDKGLDERAIADITKAIELEGKSAPAYFFRLRGDYYNNVSNFTASITDFKKAIELSPVTTRYYRGLMNSAIKAATPAEAEAVLKEAVNGAQKDNAGIRIVYGEYLMRQKRMAEADQEFTQALAENSYQPTGEDFNSASIAALNVKDIPRAVLLAEKGFSLSPKNVDIINNRASIAVQQQNWDDVYKWAQKALSVNSNSALANMLMAVGVKRTGKGDALSEEYKAKAKKLEAAGN